MAHLYDFYKPDLSSEFPVVDGALSVASYLKAIDACYPKYIAKLEKKVCTSRCDSATPVLFGQTRNVGTL